MREVFFPYRSNSRTCSRKCYEKFAYRRKVGAPEPVNCNWCGKGWTPDAKRVKRGMQDRYCSTFCRSKAVVLCNHNTTGKFLRSLFDAQLRKCAACAEPIDFFAKRSEVGSFHVDHDHGCCPTRGASCGQCIRGLLCPGCNTALGFMKEDAERIRALAHYAENCRPISRAA